VRKRPRGTGGRGAEGLGAEALAMVLLQDTQLQAEAERDQRLKVSLFVPYSIYGFLF
jgi:hypothetical protein